MPEKLNQVTVKAKAKDNKVVLWERHPDHPDEGECFIVADGKSYTVAETAAVRRLVGEGILTQGNGEGNQRSATPAQPNSQGLREPTEQEKDNANLKTERETAKVTDNRTRSAR
jgi:hypothetical protein